ncbi:MAG: hypothetical protein BWY65_02206 [Firmicutes bacterium ADurb.Bin373]|nr:MAG: hypothetical protein BWY65_02206 [Firmicutes bacterium ADurb.Bin373]
MSVSAIMLAAWACTDMPLQARIMPTATTCWVSGTGASLASLQPMVISKRPLPRAGKISGEKPSGRRIKPNISAILPMMPAASSSFMITAKRIMKPPILSRFATDLPTASPMILPGGRFSILCTSIIRRSARAAGFFCLAFVWGITPPSLRE